MYICIYICTYIYKYVYVVPSFRIENYSRYWFDVNSYPEILCVRANLYEQILLRAPSFRNENYSRSWFDANLYPETYVYVQIYMNRFSFWVWEEHAPIPFFLFLSDYIHVSCEFISKDSMRTCESVWRDSLFGVQRERELMPPFFVLSFLLSIYTHHVKRYQGPFLMDIKNPSDSCFLWNLYSFESFLQYEYMQKYTNTHWLMIAFITCDGNLVLLLEGLCSSNPCRLEFYILYMFTYIHTSDSISSQQVLASQHYELQCVATMI